MIENLKTKNKNKLLTSQNLLQYNILSIKREKIKRNKKKKKRQITKSL